MFLTSVLLAVLPLSTLALPAPRTWRRQTNATNTTDTATPNNPDIQNSLTLDPSVIATGFLNNGQSVQEPGQVASLTSGNNFINFCATVPQLPITNGKQITTGSCNPAPMGLIPSTTNMPSAKFVFPTNFATIQANTNFTIQVAISGMQTGFFVNAQQSYFAAPQQLNAQGQIIGHSHVVVETLTSLSQTTPTDPTKFAFFKGLNDAAVGGILSATANLPVGVYKVSTINTAANHQPALVPIAQHGSLDDVVYFTVTADGQADAGAAAGAASTDAGTASADAGSATSSADVGSASSSADAASASSSADAASSSSADADAASVSSSADAPAATSTAASSASAGGPPFDPSGAKNVGNGKGTQFIGGQCLSSTDCASGCCAGPSGICSGVGAQLQAGKTGCGFPSTAPANAADVSTSSAATNAGVGGKGGKGGKKGGKGKKAQLGGGQRRRFTALQY